MNHWRLAGFVRNALSQNFAEVSGKIPATCGVDHGIGRLGVGA
jgi:hypothetical protein